MVDHKRLDALTALVEHSGAKLIAVGDGKQLPSIGPGGMFDRLTNHAPTAELADIHRTKDPAEQRAWQALRAGEPERAMAHYASRGQLHLSDTRDQAAEQAVQAWAALTEGRDIREVALIADASNQEIDRLNARAQHLRAQRGELGDHEIPLPSVHYGLREGDLIAFTTQHRPHGQPRVENGTRGQVSAIHEQGVTITLDGSQRKIQLADEDLKSLRLAYAQHVYRQQGATVERTVVLTGGWQTSKETAYVEATRARRGTSWFIAARRPRRGRTGRRADHKPGPQDDQQPRAHPIAHVSGTPRPPVGHRATTPYGFALPSRQHAGRSAHLSAMRPTEVRNMDASALPAGNSDQYDYIQNRKAPAPLLAATAQAIRISGMNAERLHAIADAIYEEMAAQDTSTRFTELRDALRQSVNEPGNGGPQQRVSDLRRQLDDTLSDAPSNRFSPAWREALEEMDIASLVGQQLRDRIEAIFERNNITPSTAADELDPIVDQVTSLFAALGNVRDGLSSLKIGAEELEPGEVEIGFLIPRDAVKDELEELGKEFIKLQQILDPFLELTTGSREGVRVRTISSSAFAAFLHSAPAMGVMVATAVERRNRRIQERPRHT